MFLSCFKYTFDGHPFVPYRWKRRHQETWHVRAGGGFGCFALASFW